MKRCLSMSWLLAWSLAGCTGQAIHPPGLTGIVDYHPPVAMTGTIKERNKAILAALESDDERIAQLNLQNRSLEIALHFLANHAGADMRIDWAGLEAQGISRDHATCTLNLFKGTLGDALRALLWQARPTHGSVVFWVDHGRLNIAPRPDAAPLTESHAQQVLNYVIPQKLAEPLDLADRRSAIVPLENALYLISFSAKISMLVDWKTLEHAGIKRDTPVTIPGDILLANALITQLLAQVKPQAELGYDVRAGMVRISTQAQLAAEHELEKKVPPQ